MTNENNEFNGTVQGTLKTKDVDGSIKDINEIFANKQELETLIKKENVQDIKKIDIDNSDYSIKELANKLNELITNLQK